MDTAEARRQTGQVVMDREALNAFLAAHFADAPYRFTVERVAPMAVDLRLPLDIRHLRTGNTVSGPAMFALADVAAYVAVLAMIGPVAMAVTTNCAIDFLRKPGACDLIGEARLLKLGRSLAVADVHIRPADGGALVARAGVTYAIPQAG